jgi:hypothetical protein
MDRPARVSRAAASFKRRSARLRFNGCGVGMGLLARGRRRSRHQYDHDGTGQGTLMRHFLRVALAQGALTRSVFARAAVALLVAFSGAAQRLAPTNLRALLHAVTVAAITVPADAHLLRTAPAAIQPIGLLACPHAPRTQHWTTPRIAGIKAKGTRLYAREPAEGPGFFPGMCPGLRLSGVRTQE